MEEKSEVDGKLYTAIIQTLIGAGNPQMIEAYSHREAKCKSWQATKISSS
jgi:hypothetical protein